MFYTIQNHPYIYTFVSCSIESGEVSLTPFTRRGELVTVPALWVMDYNGAGSDKIEEMAIKSCQKFGTDTGRTHRAALIIRYNNPAGDEGCIGRAHRGQLIIQSATSDEKYTVTTKSCNCKDSQRGHICKHRIAAWMYEQKFGSRAVIPECYQFNYCLDCGSHHWLEVKDGQEFCHGLNYNPRENLPKNAIVKQRNFSSARQPAEIEILYKG